MSLTIGFIAIKGQHLNRLPEIFNFFKLVDTGNDKTLSKWVEAEAVIEEDYSNPNDYTQRRVVWVDKGWTIIEDLSLILCTDEENLGRISKQFSTPVFTVTIQSTGGSYGFSYFDKGKLRSFSNVDGDLTDSFGTALSEERDFNLNENAFEDEVLGVAKKLGIDWSNAENINHFVVKQLDNSDELNNELEEFTKKKNQSNKKVSSKPWWKFW